jgi:hypothetical protein
MNDIPFEKVTVAEARAAADAHFARPVEAAPVRKEDWTAKRQAGGLDSRELTAAAFAWLSQLPKDKRPDELARQYPRIANQLAGLWKRPLHCELYLDNLALDLRGARRGFPASVATEVAVLKEYFTTVVAPVRYDVWGERIGRIEE